MTPCQFYLGSSMACTWSSLQRGCSERPDWNDMWIPCFHEKCAVRVLWPWEIWWRDEKDWRGWRRYTKPGQKADSHKYSRIDFPMPIQLIVVLDISFCNYISVKACEVYLRCGRPMAIWDNGYRTSFVPWQRQEPILPRHCMTCEPNTRRFFSHRWFEAPKSLLKSHGTRETDTATCRMEALWAHVWSLRRLWRLRGLHPQTLPDSDASNASNATTHRSVELDESRTSSTSRNSTDSRSVDGDPWCQLDPLMCGHMRTKSFLMDNCLNLLLQGSERRGTPGIRETQQNMIYLFLKLSQTF